MTSSTPHGAIQFAIFVTFAFVISRLKGALSHADERFATVLEGLNAAVYVSDVESGRLLYANEQFHATFPEGTDYPTLRASAHRRSCRWSDRRCHPRRFHIDIRRADDVYTAAVREHFARHLTAPERARPTAVLTMFLERRGPAAS